MGAVRPLPRDSGVQAEESSAVKKQGAVGLAGPRNWCGSPSSQKRGLGGETPPWVRRKRGRAVPP